MCETLYIVVPCYNEEDVINESFKIINNKLQLLMNNKIINTDSRVLFVNDGSIDGTWNAILQLANDNEICKGICLSRNFGHQNAILCGMFEALEYADMVITMDVDLQDDIDIIDEFINKYYGGAEIVYGIRNNRESDSFLKRLTAQTYYKLMRLFGANIKYNHGDYRLMSARVIEELSLYKEVNLFLRGIIPVIGFPSENVYYKRKKRIGGKSKYSCRKMFGLAMDGITSLTTVPIRCVSIIGALVFTTSLFMLAYFLVRYFQGETVVGWASIAVSIWSLGGLQLLAIGVIGEYIGKIYLESKKRPRYTVMERTEDISRESN